MSAPSLFLADVGSGSQQAAAGAGPAQTQSLYRKYRPLSFDADDLVGQEHIVRTLRNALLLDRIAHAYLFCGPRGTGKTTTARLLAKAVNCLDLDPARRPCNVCSSCSAINAGAATDVIEIDAASNRGIDDIRDLRERVKYAPVQLRTKFYIIDEAHQITGPAANAFLKTLEEPPAHTKFVLATTDPEELLPTIVSRCQRFDFRRISLAAMAARIRTVAAAERLTIEDDAVATIARYATGSLRDALGLLDQLAVYRHDPETDADSPTPDTQPLTPDTHVITAAAVRALLGVSRNDRVETLAAALADRDPTLALATVNAAVEAGEDPRRLNRELVAYLRVLLHQRAGGSPDADERARTLAARFDLPELAAHARRFADIDYKIKHSSYAQLPLEVALVEATLAPAASTADRAGSASVAEPVPTKAFTGRDPIAIPGPAAAPPVAPPAAPPATPPVTAAPPLDGASSRSPSDDVPTRPTGPSLRDRVRGTVPRSEASSSGVAVPSVTPSGGDAAGLSAASPRTQASAAAVAPAPGGALAGAAAGVLDVERLADLWPQIRQDVKAVNRRIEALLSSVDPAVVHGDDITLAAAYEFHRDKMNTDEVRSVVEDAIARLVGRPVRVTCRLRGETPGGGTTPRTAPPDPSSSRPPSTPDQIPAHEVEDEGASVAMPATRALDPETEERRVQAAKNIFDAEEIVPDPEPVHR